MSRSFRKGSSLLMIIPCALFLLMVLMPLWSPSDSSAAELNVSVAGNGSVFVVITSPKPGTFECTTSCIYSMPIGSVVSLVPMSASSMFAEWSGACSGTAIPCNLTVAATTDVTATFMEHHEVKLSDNAGDSFYHSLNDAYDAAKASGDATATISAWAMPFTENLILNQDIALSLSGGFDLGFSLRGGTTTLEGLLRIERGSLIVDSLAIGAPPLKVTSSTPADRALFVSTGTQIAVVVSNDLKPASVHSGTVVLTGQNEFGKVRTTGLVTYATNPNTIGLSHHGLENNTRYTLNLRGFQDDAGNAVKETTLTFTTRNDQVQHEIQYRDDGTHLSCKELGFGGDQLASSSPGPDGVCFSGYDEFVYLTEDYLRDTTGTLTSEISSGPFGPPLLTATHTYNVSNCRVQTLFRNASDQVTGYLSYLYNAEGFLTSIVRYDAPGPDLLWFTPDDAVSSYQHEVFDGQWLKTRTIFYKGPGTDGVWFTGDDEIETYVTYARDIIGGVVRSTTFTGPGPDSLWQTADDQVSSCRQTEYGTNSLKSRSAHYGNPGSDGQWFTSDDLMISYDTFQYDAELNPAHRTRYGSRGPDNLWFTADDLIMATYDYTWVF